MENHQKSKLNIKQRFSYGLGNVLNEILLYMYLSFSIIFLMQVIGLSASQAGLAMFIGYITDAFTLDEKTDLLMFVKGANMW